MVPRSASGGQRTQQEQSISITPSTHQPSGSKEAPVKSSGKTSTAHPKHQSPSETPGDRGAGHSSEASPRKASAKAGAEKTSRGRVGKRSEPEVHDEDQPRDEFLAEARQLLVEERDNYLRQAEELKAEADSLALEHEPGDVQFDEEGGEGGTSNVDRELDLVLSAQARAAILEIDRALAKIEAGTYGVCEQCGKPIPQPRLKALPYAALCVACKSGGLSSRR
jgi:DnaK suppressor protein